MTYSYFRVHAIDILKGDIIHNYEDKECEVTRVERYIDTVAIYTTELENKETHVIYLSSDLL